MADKPNTDTLPVTGESHTDQAPAGDQGSEATATGEAKFTQADVDRILKERLDRERAKVKEVAAKVADYDQLKTRLTELEQAQLSEDEKRQRKLKELEEQKMEAETKAAQALQEANRRLMRTAVMAAAVEAGFQAPEDAFSLLDANSVTVDDEGNVTGAAEAVLALAAAKPYLLRSRSAPNINAAPAGAPTNGLPRLSPEQERIARNMGISPEKYAQRLAERQASTRR